MAKRSDSWIVKAAVWLGVVALAGHVDGQDTSPTGPTMSGTVANCDAWYTVVTNDTCYSIEEEFGITADEFIEWNPDVSSDCLTNFWVGESYCVGVTALISTTTSAPGTGSTGGTSTTSSSIELSSTTGISSTTSLEVSSTTKSAVNTTTTPYSTRYEITSYNLTAPYTATAYPPTYTLGGEPSYCNSWHKINAGETCDTIVARFANSATLDELIEWNPTLGDDCGGLYVGWYICVGTQPQTTLSLGWSTSATNATIPSATAFTATTYTTVANFTASPQQTGIPSTCENYYLAEENDTCTTVLEAYGYLTEDQFFEWNPALGDDCNGLYLGYYYCVGVSDFLPVPPTVTASPSPVGTDTVTTCTAWYMAEVDDDCADIAEIFGTFSEDDFITWNPSVWSSCSNIQQGTYYCVAIPGTATSRTAAIPSTTDSSSMPTQTGMATDCSEIWFVSSSDTCDSIIADNDISSGDFYAWNPAIGTDCSSLLPNYYVCVGNATTTTTTTTTTTSSTSSLSSPATTTTSGASVTTPSPIMPGMVDSCNSFYYRGDDESALYCADIATAAGITLTDFYSWNPEVGDDCSDLWADSWYCVGVAGTVTTIANDFSTATGT